MGESEGFFYTKPVSVVPGGFFVAHFRSKMSLCCGVVIWVGSISAACKVRLVCFDVENNMLIAKSCCTKIG